MSWTHETQSKVFCVVKGCLSWHDSTLASSSLSVPVVDFRPYHNFVYQTWHCGLQETCVDGLKHLGSLQKMSFETCTYTYTMHPNIIQCDKYDFLVRHLVTSSQYECGMLFLLIIFETTFIISLFVSFFRPLCCGAHLYENDEGFLRSFEEHCEFLGLKTSNLLANHFSTRLF